MTNTNRHHFEKRVFSRQSHPTIEHYLSTVSPASTVQRTNIPETAGMPRLLTLDADHIGTSRNSGRLPARQIEEWPIYPTHQQASQTTREGTRTSTTYPNTVANTITSGPTSGRGALPNPDTLHSSFRELQRPLGGVRQDKDRFASDRAASRQPAAVKEFTRSQATSRKSARTQKGDSDNRRTVPVQVWVSPLVKSEPSRIASSEGLSLSAAGAALLTRGIQQNVDIQRF